MPTVEKRWDAICAQISFHQQKSRETFDFFVKIATAVTGGAAYLSTQDKVAQAARRMVLISDLLIVFASLLTAFIIYEHHKAWRGWRVAQSNIAGVDCVTNKRNVPLPQLRSSRVEAAMALSSVVFAIGFVVFNPLGAL